MFLVQLKFTIELVKLLGFGVLVYLCLQGHYALFLLFAINAKICSTYVKIADK